MPKRLISVPDRSLVTETTPLRLAVAAELAFPGGGMTASGLRRERDAGRLVTKLIAGREFTTLADIGRMREMCRRKVKEPKPRQADVDADRERARAALTRTIERLIGADDERRRAAREARLQEREAIRGQRRARTGAAAPKRPPRA